MDALKRAQGAFAFYHLPDTARMLVALGCPAGAGLLTTCVHRRGIRYQTMRWLTTGMVAPVPEPDPIIDPSEPVPDDPAELLPDAPAPLPPPSIEATPDDPGGDSGGVPEPA
jgi:hypothetical protein